MKAIMTRLHYTVFLIFMLVHLLKATEPCSTIWKSGKYTAECSKKELLIIPDGLDSALQVLEFSDNNIQTLHSDKFLKLNLTNLQRIFLSHCKMIRIEKRPFRGLSNLVELDLSYNYIDTIPTESFLDCPQLMKLHLNNNPIKVLEKLAFNHLTQLNTLQLHDCQIAIVDKNAFDGLYNLEKLNLYNNKLNYFNASDSLPKSLKDFNLQENPWVCDCHLISLHEWLNSVVHPQSTEPICTAPLRLKNQTIKSVKRLDLACLADVTPTSFYLEIEEGKNVSLLCQVKATPEAKIIWLYEGKIIQNDTVVEPGLHVIFFIEHGTIEKRSELFIYNTNSEDNGTFICSAENPAGITIANYTIKVILKPVPTEKPEELPYEFMLIIVSTSGASVVLLLVVIILTLIKCCRNRTIRKKIEESKATARTTTKDNLLEDSLEENEQTKELGNIKVVDPKEEMVVYNARSIEEILGPIKSTRNNDIESVLLYPDQNPDIINGTDYNYPIIDKTATLSRKSKLPTISEHKSCDCQGCVLQSNIPLDPIGLIHNEEVRPKFSSNCYKTLPYNRGSKRQHSASAMSIFSHEAEFLNRSAKSAYEHFDPRYTADGYPVRTVENYVYSPASSVCSSAVSEPCCSTKLQKPACLAAAFKEPSVIKKCVGAQTQTEFINPKLSGNVAVKENKTFSDTMPDEQL